MARGYKPRTARDARTTLTTLLGDAIPQYIQFNPAQRKRGKGRKGQRRIERKRQAEKVWPTPLQALLVAERCAALSGSDTDFVMVITLAYTGMRWSEVLGLAPADVRDDLLHIDRKLYELGRFYLGPPKDGSIRDADLPPFLAELLASHLGRDPGRKCRCRNPQEPWCRGGEYVFLGPRGIHFRRSEYGERRFRPAADGWYPGRKPRPAMPVLADISDQVMPGRPLQPWRAAQPGETYSPPSGRGVTRLVSDERTGRCGCCRRALPRRLDGAIIAHKAAGRRCPGSGQPPGEDMVLASWLPVSLGLTPHGFRHGHKTWMDEARITDVLKSERLGHDEPGMRGVYGHVSPGMRSDLKAALQERWEASLCERTLLGPRSLVPVLDALLSTQRDASAKIGSHFAPRFGHHPGRLAARSRRKLL